MINSGLPAIVAQSRYTWFNFFMSYWSVFSCGGDCAEGLSINIKPGLEKNPFIKTPSPDRVLNCIKSLSEAPQTLTAERGSRNHLFSLSDNMNRLNLKLISLLPGLK